MKGQTAAGCTLIPAGHFALFPPVTRIVAALSKGETSAATTQLRWRGLLTALPGIGASLLPAVTCPACWPAYAAVLATLGFGFLLETTYLFPVTAALLAVALASFAYRAQVRHEYRPLTFGVVGVGLVNRNSRWLLWGVPAGVVVLGGFIGPSLRMFLWTPAFLVMGVACLVNAARCGRVHCYITGPLFLIAGGASLLLGLGLAPLEWSWIGGGIVVGVVLAHVPEWICRKYVQVEA